jgi:hypothetical protein
VDRQLYWSWQMPKEDDVSELPSPATTLATTATPSDTRRLATPPRLRRSAGEKPRRAHEQDWQPPIITKDFRPRIAFSIVEEFVAGHDAGDVLRELVQNEFDAGGTQVSVTFGRKSLTVVGNGRPIDAKGWSRLDVILGTGKIIGGNGDVSVEPKENGIGSKNFGLRSLFLFGNRIYVRSNGRMAVLDLPTLGPQQLEDTESRGRSGVYVHVPYRSEQFQSLAAFTVEQEQKALDQIQSRLLPTLVKLALPGARPGIRVLTLVSERTGRELNWRQRADPLKCKVKGVSAVRRVGRLSNFHRADAKRARAQIFEEIEFCRSTTIPTEHVNVPYPAYYRASDSSLRVCVSVPIRRARIDCSQPGQFYYPLQTPQGFTGVVVSVSAPFKLDADRTSLLDANWNSWLADEAVRLVQDLLSGDWLDRFGAHGYLALDALGLAAPAGFAKKIAAHLREATCWPTQEFSTTKALAKASDIAVADNPLLEGFLSKSCYLDQRLSADKDATDLALRNGAKRFTLNSRVRLRCADEDTNKLHTKPREEEANYHFTNYETALGREGQQQQMARAITKLSKHLSNENRRDLRETASTLAADGSLRPALKLVRVDENLWEGCPEPSASRLHPSLLTYKGIAGLCRPFARDAWIVDAAGRASAALIEDTERRALYRYLLVEGTKVGQKALAAVRRSPVVLDQHGQWVAPENLAQLPSAEASLLNAVVSAPAPALASRTELLRRLRIRRKLSAGDLTRFGPTIDGDAAIASAFEQLLNKHQRLLTPKTVASLHSIPFLRTKKGGLLEPGRLHLATSVNIACLDRDDAIVAGENIALYRRLGCQEHPTFETLSGVLEGLRRSGTPPRRPDIFYPTLVKALAAKKYVATALVDDPILWVEGAYRIPEETLVGSRIPRFFRAILPVFDGPEEVARAYEELGASSSAMDYHWAKFFESFDQSGDSQAGSVCSMAEQKTLRAAYQRRAHLGLPAELDDTITCLLARDGSLHSLKQLREAKFLEDDYPQLSAVLNDYAGDIAFADDVEGNRSFFMALGLRRLSDVCGDPRLEIGSTRPPPGWFKPARLDDIISLFQMNDFAIALREVAWTYQRQSQGFRAPRATDLRRRLASIDQLQFVSEISRVYRVAGISARVQSEAAASDGKIFFAACAQYHRVRADASLCDRGTYGRRSLGRCTYARCIDHAAAEVPFAQRNAFLPQAPRSYPAGMVGSRVRHPGRRTGGGRWRQSRRRNHSAGRRKA